MLQIIFLVIGLCIIVLALSFAFKRYARLILWSSAITLFAGTLLLVGIGVINPIDGDNTGSTTFWGTIITLISGAALAFCAEMLKEGNKGKIKVQNGNSSVSEEQSVGGRRGCCLDRNVEYGTGCESFCESDRGWLYERKRFPL